MYTMTMNNNMMVCQADLNHNEVNTQEEPQDNNGDIVSNEQIKDEGLSHDGDKLGETPGVDEWVEHDSGDNASEIPGVDDSEGISDWAVGLMQDQTMGLILWTI